MTGAARAALVGCAGCLSLVAAVLLIVLSPILVNLMWMVTGAIRAVLHLN